MNASQLFADINTGCLTEVAQAANSYYDQNRGLTVRQSFYVYPDDTIVALKLRGWGLPNPHPQRRRRRHLLLPLSPGVSPFCHD